MIRTDSSRLWGARDRLEGNGDKIKLKFRKIISSVYDDVGERDSIPQFIVVGSNLLLYFYEYQERKKQFIGRHQKTEAGQTGS